MTTVQILITPAPDCPTQAATPPPRKPKPTRATLEYDLLSEAPCAFDHKDFTYAVHQAMAAVAGRPALDFDAFHAKGKPCMRASPLTKRYGWAAHYDAGGKLALVDPASAGFAALAADPALPQKPAMRSGRG